MIIHLTSLSGYQVQNSAFFHSSAASQAGIAAADEEAKDNK